MLPWQPSRSELTSVADIPRGQYQQFRRAEKGEPFLPERRKIVAESQYASYWLASRLQIPALGDMTPPNFALLFRVDKNNVYLRTDIDNRCLSTCGAYPVSDMPWTKIRDRIMARERAKTNFP
jgi:hypothetical protein